MRIAIDTGGTFTDCVFQHRGKLHIIKVPSQPKTPAMAIAAALREVRRELGKDAFGRLDLLCGTTVGTNALLERRGGRVNLITTAGFEDVLEIGRQARPKLYDLQFQKPEMLVPSARRIGAQERVAADGSVVTALSSREIHRILKKVRDARADAVAVAFLFSFRNPRHEAKLARELRRAGFLVSVSHEILPEFREFERTSTTVINAYLAPVMAAYLGEAQVQADRAWTESTSRKPNTQPRVRVMQSNGGMVSAAKAAAEPVRTVLSGPAGGVQGAAYAAKLAGYEKIITFDMGGTSTDVALLSGELQITTESRVAGLPVAVPMLEIHTVGAGGGSIARFDAGGALRVGPESAGAEPGPICYGRGEMPTVTDAHGVLGHFGGKGLLNGGFELHLNRARRDLDRRKGGFKSLEDFAQGILGVSNAVIERAVRLISIERGHDPRDYTLVAFGGAGGLHACELADALEMRGVLLPVFPGGLSALGILRADVVRDFSHTVMLPVASVSQSLHGADRMRKALTRQATDFLRDEGFAESQRRFGYTLDVRCVGQAYDLSVEMNGDFVRAFHLAHERAYGHADPTRPIEIVNVRCRATGVTPRAPLLRVSKTAPRITAKPIGEVPCFFSGKRIAAKFFERERLRAGEMFSGPAIITEYSATSLLPPGWMARVDRHGQIHLRKARPSGKRYGKKS